MLAPAERMAAAQCLRAIAERARTLLRHLPIYDVGNEYILSIPLDQLDTPEAFERYSRSYKERRDAHPAARFAFGSQ